MKLFKLKALSALLLIPSLSVTQAAEQPKAEDLVGKFYVGLHAAMMSVDDDRRDWMNTDFDGGDGFGAEVGYRFSPEVEFRFSYTDLSFDRDDNAPDDSGSAMSIDALYFINQKNLYLLGGLNNLDIENTDISANLGAGYRYYFSKNLAAYAEGKGHYQFDENYVDYTAQIGLTYFFGGSNKSSAVTKPAPTQAAKPQSSPAKVIPVVADLDSDKDGILDSQDKCANTPTTDKVDENGCTIFAKETLTQRLLINFDNNQSVIKAEYYDDVERLAGFLKQYPNVNVTIAGHTSSQGSAKYNQTLSQKRAEAVVALLTSKYGIAPSRLDAEGFGESQLVNLDNTQKAHNENRRIEALVKVQESVPVKR